MKPEAVVVCGARGLSRSRRVQRNRCRHFTLRRPFHLRTLTSHTGCIKRLPVIAHLCLSTARPHFQVDRPPPFVRTSYPPLAIMSLPYQMFRGMHEHAHRLRQTLLEDNYRSRPKVLTVAAHVLEVRARVRIAECSLTCEQCSMRGGGEGGMRVAARTPVSRSGTGRAGGSGFMGGQQVFCHRAVLRVLRAPLVARMR